MGTLRDTCHSIPAIDAGFDAVRGVGAEMEVVAADLRIPVRGRTFVVKVFEVEGDVFEPVAEHQVRLFV